MKLKSAIQIIFSIGLLLSTYQFSQGSFRTINELAEDPTNNSSEPCDEVGLTALQVPKAERIA